MEDTRYKKLTLLHSNDMHGDFLEEDRDGVIRQNLEDMGRGELQRAGHAEGAL